jgi:adenosyl cobinamide kinase/adenosyl cobinamide phosphate guanylyltransferase
LGTSLQYLAFGRAISDIGHSALDDVALVLSGLPRRYKRCTAVIVMRGVSSDYEDWVAVTVTAASLDAEMACAEWIRQHVTRRGYALLSTAL